MHGFSLQREARSDCEIQGMALGEIRSNHERVKSDIRRDMDNY